MEYRRHLDSETWHFSASCSQWPKDFNLILLDQLRVGADICSECISAASTAREANPEVKRFVTESISDIRMHCESSWITLKRFSFNFEAGPSALTEAQGIVAN